MCWFLKLGPNFRCLLNVGRLRVEPAGARYGRAVLALGVVAAVGASALYNTSIALQALEAREVPRIHTLRPSLLGRLVRNRRWLVATAVGLLGWPLEIAALLLAPLTVVQPCVASGLILLLWLGATRLGEKPGPREAIAVAAIVVGVIGIAAAAPSRTTAMPTPERSPSLSSWWRFRSLAPYLRRRPPASVGLLAVLSAGCCYAWTAVATKLATDGLATGAIAIAVVWLASAAASEGIGLLSEMSALQRRPATHVAPPMFAIQVLVPVSLAPLIFGESWGATPLGGTVLAISMAVAVGGCMLLAGSRPVGAAIERRDRGGRSESGASSLLALDRLQSWFRPAKAHSPVNQQGATVGPAETNRLDPTRFAIGFDQRDRARLFELWGEVLDSGQWSEGPMLAAFEERWSAWNGLPSLGMSSWAGAALARARVRRGSGRDRALPVQYLHGDAARRDQGGCRCRIRRLQSG